MEQVNILLQESGHARNTDLGYGIGYIQGKERTIIYQNIARELSGIWNISKIDCSSRKRGKTTSLCTTRTREAADEALYQLAKQEAQKLFETLETPKIIDTTKSK